LQAGELCLRTAQPMTGPLRLEQAHVSVLDDDAARWPPQIWLNGFTYGNIRHGSARVPVREGLAAIGSTTGRRGASASGAATPRRCGAAAAP
jgi:hypothetical protein